MQIRKHVPWAMVAFRTALGPLVLVGERCRWNGAALAAMVVAALLSDIFDGVLARRWKTDTAALRLADSLADTAFYLCVAAAIGLYVPAVWQACRGGVLLVVGFEVAQFTFAIAKFGKPASYHSYLAKAWGLVLAAAVIVTFATQHLSLWMSAAIAVGVLSNAETMAMSLVLPVWHRDVKTLARAWRLRGESKHGSTNATGAVAAASLALLLVLLAAGDAPVQAQTFKHVTYVGGTALPANGLHGKLSITSADAIVFEGPATLTIPYDHVISYESKTRRQVHVGLLTEGVWRLVAPWPEAKQLSLSYRDANEQPQVVQLEMSHGDEALLVEVLKTRVSRWPAHPPLAAVLHTPAVAPEKATEH